MAFINLQRLLDANREDVDEMGLRAAKAARPDINNATQSLGQYGANPLGTVENPLEKVARGMAKAQMLGSTGGLAELTAGGGKEGAPQSTGGGLLDAFLAGNSGAVTQLRQQAANLPARYDAAQKSAQGVTNQYAAMAQAQQQQRQEQMRQQAPSAPTVDLQDKATLERAIKAAADAGDVATVRRLQARLYGYR